jgi:hypothetical protein
MAVRYGLFHSSGEPATSFDRDDVEHELWSDSVAGLVADVATWLGVSNPYVLERLQENGNLVIEPGDVVEGGKTFQIIRQETTSDLLADEDRKEIARLKSS